MQPPLKLGQGTTVVARRHSREKREESIMGTTVQDVINTILEAVPGALVEDTVDTIKSGDPSWKVTGIVTTFLASHEVIQRAIALGANLIITHEPTYYNHRDEVDWLADDPVYEAKRRLIDENRIAIWRFHDYWHRHRPDGILTGAVKELGYEGYVDPETPTVYHIPPTSLQDLAAWFKEKLGICTVRVVGDLEMTCRCVGLLLGAMGGRRQMEYLKLEDVDVLVCGEIAEWETSEYVRDAVAQGKNKALMVLGHANSEEPGMKWLVEWLRPRLPGISITHLPVGDPFHFL
jgi:putative NIF3 family GTP cyclohydrolase 1 type 2